LNIQLQLLINRFPNSELYSAFNILDPKEPPSNNRELDLYGNQEMKMLSNFHKDKCINGNEFRGIIDKDKLIQE
jgi:hypothetical protein